MTGLGRRSGVLLAGVVVAVAVAAGAPGAPRPSDPRPDPGRAPDVPTPVARVAPAVVGLEVAVPHDRPSAATLGTARRGTGVLIDPDGTILTVGYLVLEATRVEVRLRDGRVRPAKVLGHDFDSGLAVVRLADPGPYPVARLGRSAGVGAGHPVSIVGVAEDGDLVAAAARVHAVRRFVAYWEYMLERALIVHPVHPAFGGAALVDADGALLGLVSLRLEHEHVAIPIDLWPPVHAAVLAHGRPGRPPRPWLGIRAVAVAGGVGVAGVAPVGPARAAGLRAGDVIVRLDGERIADLEDFYRKLWGTAIGSAVQLMVVRGGQLESVTVRPGDRHALYRFRDD